MNMNTTKVSITNTTPVYSSSSPRVPVRVWGTKTGRSTSVTTFRVLGLSRRWVTRTVVSRQKPLSSHRQVLGVSDSPEPRPVVSTSCTPGGSLSRCTDFVMPEDCFTDLHSFVSCRRRTRGVTRPTQVISLGPKTRRQSI